MEDRYSISILYRKVKFKVYVSSPLFPIFSISPSYFYPVRTTGWTKNGANDIKLYFGESSLFKLNFIFST